eukprot:1174716-Pleurochrysis_carterae.AAC.1
MVRRCCSSRGAVHFVHGTNTGSDALALAQADRRGQTPRLLRTLGAEVLPLAHALLEKQDTPYVRGSLGPDQLGAKSVGAPPQERAPLSFGAKRACEAIQRTSRARVRLA